MRLFIVAIICVLSACSPLSQRGAGSAEAFSAELIAELGGPFDDASVQAYVDGIGQQLTAAIGQDARQFEFTVVDNHLGNAFALPNGDVLVTRGMVGASRDRAELAAVIAHEIAHLAAGHADALAQRRSELLSNMGQGQMTLRALERQSDGLKRDLAAFNREQEQEADNIAITYLVEAGFDPRAHVDRLAAYAAEEQLDVAAGVLPSRALRPDIYDRHPPTTARLASARARVASLPPGGSRGREAHLAVTEDLIWGMRPDGIVVRGGTFFEPDAGFTLSVPQGFSVIAEPARALFISDTVLIVYQRLDREGFARMRPAFGANATAVTGAGYEGIVTTSRETAGGGQPDVMIRSVTLSDAQSDIQFAAVTPDIIGAQRRLGALDQMLASLDAYDARSAEAPRSRRITLLTVGAGDTVADLAARMAVDDAPEARFRLLNGLGRTGDVQPGQRVRLIVE